MWRRGVIVGAIAVGAVAGLVVGLQSPRVAESLKDRLERTAQESFGLTVEIRSLEIELLPPGLAFAGVEVYKPGRAPPWIVLHRGRVQLRPWPSATGALVLDLLELDGLAVDGLDLAELDLGSDTGRLPIDIRELMVWNARVAVASAEGSARFAGADLVMQPHPEGGRRLDLDVAVGEVTVGSDTFAFETRSHARLYGTLDRPERLALEQSQIFLKQIALKASGELALSEVATEARGEEEEGDGDRPRRGMLLKVEGGVSLAHLRALVPDLPDIRGQAQLVAEIRGDARDLFEPPLVRVHAEVADLRVEGRALGDLNVDAVYETTQVNLEAFRVTHPTLGAVTGSGRIDLTRDSPTLAVTARVHRLSLPVVLNKAGFDQVWVKLLVSGDVQGTGDWASRRFDGRVDVYGEQLAVLDRDFRAPDPRVILAIERVDVSGPFSVGARGVELRGVAVTRGRTALTVEGLLSFDPDLGLDLHVSGDRLDMADVGPIADVPFAGHGTVFATLEGAYGPQIAISSTVALAEMAVFGHGIGDTRGTVVFEYPTLSVDRATIERTRGTATGKGWIRFDPSPVQASAAFSLNGVDLAGLLASVGVEPAFAQRLRAVTSGQLALSGPLVDPVGVIDLKTDLVAMDGVPLGPASALVRLDGEARTDDRVAHLVIEGRPGGGRVRTTIGVHVPSPGSYNLAIEADAAGILLSAVTPLLDDAPLVGTVSGAAELSGPPRALSGTFSLLVPALSAWGVALRATEINAIATAGEAAVQGATLDGGGTVKGTLILGRRLPFTTEVTLTKIALGQAVTLPRDTAVTLSGTVFSQGDLTRPQLITADIQLSEAKVATQGIELGLVRPAHFLFAQKRLDIVDLDLQGPRANLRVGGRVSDPAGLGLSITAAGDLGVVVPFLPPLEGARGPFDASLRVVGDWGSPFIEGGANVRGARLDFKALREDVTDVTAVIEFAGRNIDIRDGAGTLGGGALTFNGGAVLPAAAEPAQLNLYTDFSRVTVRPRPGMVAVGSGSVSLAGPLGDLLLKGRVALDELRYTRNLELSIDGLFPKKDAPLKVPDFAPGQTVAVDVHVEAPGNIFLNANQLSAEFKASLDFRGTTESLGLHGNLTPLWAKARYRDLEFAYVSGDIAFTEDFRVRARYDLTAQAEGCDMTLTLNVVGDSLGENTIEVTGEDAGGRADEDAYTCVFHGFRISERTSAPGMGQSLLGSEGAGLSETLGTGLDMLWSVSGVDAKVKRLLPYVDEARITIGRSGRRGQNLRTAPRLVVRTNVRRRLQLKYDGALDEVDDHIVGLEYQLTDVARLEGAWVSLSDVPVGDFGLDLRLRWEFD